MILNGTCIGMCVSAHTCTLVWPLYVWRFFSVENVKLPPPSFVHLVKKVVCAKFFSDRITLTRAANALKIPKASPEGTFFKNFNKIMSGCLPLCFICKIILNYREIMCVKFGGGRRSLSVHPKSLAN